MHICCMDATSGVIFENKKAFLVGFIYIRDPSQTFVEWGADAKRRALRSFDSPKEALKKVNFPGKIEFMIFYGTDP